MRLRNECCRAKAINIKYSEYVSVALFIQHVTRMRHDYQLKPLWLYHMFLHIL
jgi:hypothetical protein